MKEQQPPVIAIDGPAASGKTTIGRLLADDLGYLFLDTGSMYRAVTLAVLQQNVAVDDEAAVTAVALSAKINIQPATDHQDGRFYTVYLNGEDVTWAIRSQQVDTHVSLVSSYLAVRKEMVKQQRTIAQQGNVVMVGRDIGTVVLPDAPLKLYMTASPEERARRRLGDREKRGVSADYEAILADIIRRDKYDSNREHSPLKPAVDALVIDTSNDTPEAVVLQIKSLWPTAVTDR
ncbi:MAG: (d)CMP kinase [Anaerolineales bacterium]|nr:(d)CMP kinase [Anaerolineales bacterium]